MRPWAIYYYDNVRGHSSPGYQTPFAYLKSQLPDIDAQIRFVIPIMLVQGALKLVPLEGDIMSWHSTIIGLHGAFEGADFERPGVGQFCISGVFPLLLRE